MNESFCPPMAVTNGEIRENGEVKKSASGDTCVGDSLKVDPCEPVSKGSDSLVKDSADTVVENEVEDDFKLALSPEASGTDSLAEQNQEDSTSPAIKSSSNIPEDMEVDKHKEEPKLSEETEGPNLGKESCDIARLSDVNLGSDINNCAVGEGVVCGGSEIIVDKDCASDGCVGNTSNNVSGKDVSSSLEEVADPVKEIRESSEVSPGLPLSVSARQETEDADPRSNPQNCQESLPSSFTQDESEVTTEGVKGANTEVSSTSSTAQNKVEDAIQRPITESCPENSNNLISLSKKSTNAENDSVPILNDLKNDAQPALLDVKYDTESVLDAVENNGEPVLNNVKNNKNSVLVDFKSSAEPSVGNDKNDAEPVLGDFIVNSEHVLDQPVKLAESVSNKVKRNDNLGKNIEPVLNDFNINAESVADDECERNVKMSSSEKETVNEETSKLEGTSNVEKGLGEQSSEVKNEGVLEEDSIMVEKAEDGTVLGCTDSESKSNLDKVASPNMKTSKIYEKITSPDDQVIDGRDDKGASTLNDQMKNVTTLPTNQTNDEKFTSTNNDIRDGTAEQSDAAKEDALLVYPFKNTPVGCGSSVCKSPIGMDDEDFLKSPERKDEKQALDIEMEAALLSSPGRKVSENKLLEEETEALEDDALLNSPEPKIVSTDEADTEMKENDLLNSPKSRMTANIVESEEKMEDDSTPNSLQLGIAPPSGVEVAVSKDTPIINFKSIVEAALKDEEVAPVDDNAKNISPASQETGSLKSDALNEIGSSREAAVQVQEAMEVEDEPCKESVPPSKEEEKAHLKLELNGTSYCSDSSDVKSTIISNNSRKDDEGSASMTLSRKRAHSPVVDCRVLDEKSKFARTVNGFDEGSPDADASPKKEEAISIGKKKRESSIQTPDDTVSKIVKSNVREEKKDVSEASLECEADTKSKDELEEARLDPVDLSYLRKLHKGQVEKLSRNDLEELLVQKLCEAITERSEVGEMRLRCQALERGQEKWKEKYSQLQKQVRELNIVIKKFLSEQASATKDKSTPPTPVRITRSVGLQVALPGSSQRTLAGMRIRAQREAAAGTASSVASGAAASSAIVSSTVPASALASTPSSTSNANANKAANTNSPNVSTASNCGPVRTVAVTQSPARRLQETPTKITSPTLQQLPQRPINSSVMSNTTVASVNSTPPRVCSAPQPSLTLTRPQTSAQVQPQMGGQVQPQIQTTQISGNIRARANPSVTMRGHQQTHVVQQRQQPIQPAAHSSVSQVVVSSNSTPQISRLQVVLAPQQQQQLLQSQQIVLRQAQPANKDVEIIDLDKDDRSRHPTRNTVQQIPQVTATPTFPPNGNMTVRLVSNQQVQLNSNQGKSRTNSGVVLKGVVQAMQTQTNTVRQQGVVPQGTIIPSRGLTIVQQTQQAQQQMPQLQQLRQLRMTHPAPLPAAPAAQPDNPNWKMSPPKPSLKIQHTDNGIVLSWNMNLYTSHEDIDTYQLYAYQEGHSPPSSSLWKKVGDVKALPLPMACTLTQFAEGHRYHFAVRAVDIRARIGPFSAPGNIRLEQKTQ